MLGAGRGRQTVRGREKHAKFEFREKEGERESRDATGREEFLCEFAVGVTFRHSLFTEVRCLCNTWTERQRRGEIERACKRVEKRTEAER